MLEGKEPQKYCDGLVVAELNSSSEFNFTDGSAVNAPYANDSECYFLLRADMGNHVALDLTRFSLEETFDHLSVRIRLSV